MIKFLFAVLVRAGRDNIPGPIGHGARPKKKKIRQRQKRASLAFNSFHPIPQ